MGITGLQASWLKIRWTTISSQPHTHLPNTEFSTKQSPTQHPKRSQPQNTDQMPHHADFPSWRLNCFGIWDVYLFRDKALEKDRVQSSFHNKCRLQMLRVHIFGWIFPVTLASLISRSGHWSLPEKNLSFVWDIQCMSPQVSTLNIFCDDAHLWRNWWRYIAFVVWLPNICSQAKGRMGLTHLLLSLLFSSVSALTTSELTSIRAKLERKVIRGSNVPTALRLAFHDCVGRISNNHVKDIWRYLFRQVAATAVWTWTTRPILALKTSWTSWRRSTRTRDTRVSYQGLVSYSIIQLHWHCCCKQGGLLGACWHRCRWQGHRERQRGLRLRRLRRSRLWSHFPMGASSRCSRH